MGVCGLCNREMMDVESCVENKKIEYEDGELLDALPVGTRWTDGKCADCWAPPESMHHPRCDWEECPRCGGQLLSCTCDVVAHVQP